jgi:hypothetical protein
MHVVENVTIMLLKGYINVAQVPQIMPGVCVCLSFCVHVRIGRLVPPPPPPLFCVFWLLEMCVEMSTRRRVWVSRGQKTLH